MNGNDITVHGYPAEMSTPNGGTLTVSISLDRSLTEAEITAAHMAALDALPIGVLAGSSSAAFAPASQQKEN